MQEVGQNPFARSAHHAEGNITHEERITFRASGTHRSKNKSTSYEVLLFLSRVDKKDAICHLSFYEKDALVIF